MSNPAPFQVERIERHATAAMLEPCHAVRRAVFVEEQAISADLEWDHLDAEAEHFLARTPQAPQAQSKPVGTARLRIVGESQSIAKAERVAVLASARTTGIGRALMYALESRAIELGCRHIRLNAQISVLRFYENLGYTAEAEPFEEAGIEHLAMSKRLAPKNQSASR